MTRLPKHKVHLGDTVTCRRPVESFHDKGMIQPGEPGTVATLDSPSVTYAYRKRPGGTATQVVVDFTGPDGRKRRARLDYTNIKHVH